MVEEGSDDTYSLHESTISKQTTWRSQFWDFRLQNNILKNKRNLNKESEVNFFR